MDYEILVNHNIVDLTLLANQNNARIANQEKRKRKKNKGKKKFNASRANKPKKIRTKSWN